MRGMAAGTLQIVHTYTIIQCTHDGCGVHFGLDDDFIRARRRDRKNFYCPNGHSRWYPGKTEAQQALDEAQEQRQRAECLARQVKQIGERLETERRSHSATKGQLTKTRKRAAHGVCPYCTRTFSNVARHVAHQHPTELADE